MSDRKNLFLNGRQSNDEDQLTEMLAALWQFEPELPCLGLGSLGLDVDNVGRVGLRVRPLAPWLRAAMNPHRFMVVISRIHQLRCLRTGKAARV
jgi:hypothetical protein